MNGAAVNFTGICDNANQNTTAFSGSFVGYTDSSVFSVSDSIFRFYQSQSQWFTGLAAYVIYSQFTSDNITISGAFTNDFCGTGILIGRI